jgi:uncharacterized membrane protein YkgB
MPLWALRISLGAVFLWFGALKLSGHSPVLALLRDAYGSLVTQPAYLALALFECALGAVLLSGFWRRQAAAMAALHLLGTMSILVVAPQLAFRPFFPVLTMTGEFVVKNLVLISAAVALVFDGGALRLPASRKPTPPPPH